MFGVASADDSTGFAVPRYRLVDMHAVQCWPSDGGVFTTSEAIRYLDTHSEGAGRYSDCRGLSCSVRSVDDSVVGDMVVQCADPCSERVPDVPDHFICNGNPNVVDAYSLPDNLQRCNAVVHCVCHGAANHACCATDLVAASTFLQG